jgi:anti-sigma regulatory factor (Ser/Thr protein kinase)
MNWLSDIRLPARPSGVRRARQIVEDLDADLAQETRDDLRLLVSEVTTNAVRHGSRTHGVGTTIRLRVGLEDDVVRVEVHDRGPGFQHVPRGPDAEPGSGWGVHFVHTLTDRWGAGRDEAGAWVVWFELRAPGAQGGGASMTYGQRAVEGSPLREATSGPGRAQDTRGDGRDSYATTG